MFTMLSLTRILFKRRLTFGYLAGKGCAITIFRNLVTFLRHRSLRNFTYDIEAETHSLLPYGHQGKCYLVIYGLKRCISKQLGGRLAVGIEKEGIV